MMPSFFFHSFLGLSLAISSCGPREATPHSHLSIIGGTTAKPGEFPETVAILRNSIAICTATVIAKKLVITAAHCIETVPLNELKIFWGEDAAAADSSNTVAVTSAQLHPQLWTDYLSGNDLAILGTADNIPVLPAPLLITIPTAMNNVTVTGFGVTSNIPAESTRGVKTWAATSIQSFSGNDLYAGNGSTDTCQGDSGGPAFISLKNGARSLLAVTSRGPMPCGQDHDPGIFTLARATSCWLLDVLKDPIPAWQTACDLFQNGRALALSRRELKHSTQLHAPNESIRSIAVLAQSVALTAIDLSYNQIIDPSPLLNVKSLKYVDLRNNQISDLSVFAKLQARGIVVLGAYTQAQNFAETEFLRIAKLGFDAGVDNRATVIALRDVLTKGNTERKSRDLAMRHSLGLSNRGVRSLAPLEHLENLSTLLLSDNPLITDLSTLKTLPKLQYLDIRGTGVPLQDETQHAILSDLRARGVTVVTEATQ